MCGSSGCTSDDLLLLWHVKLPGASRRIRRWIHTHTRSARQDRGKRNDVSGRCRNANYLHTESSSTTQDRSGSAGSDYFECGATHQIKKKEKKEEQSTFDLRLATIKTDESAHITPQHPSPFCLVCPAISRLHHLDPISKTSPRHFGGFSAGFSPPYFQVLLQEHAKNCIKMSCDDASRTGSPREPKGPQCEPMRTENGELRAVDAFWTRLIIPAVHPTLSFDV